MNPAGIPAAAPGGSAEKTRPEIRYIVFDLEWNQSSGGRDGEVPGMPFEIIEIGAVKLDQNLREIGEFTRFVRPAVYQKLHFKVLEIMQVGMEELKTRGEPFPEVCREFLEWCLEKKEGEEIQPVFCTWGSMDLTELQRNMAYHGVENPFPSPLLYYDIQKLYNLLYENNSKNKLPLERAVEETGLQATDPFHRALDDARYTAEVMEHIDFDSVRAYLSLDYYRLPEKRSEEIYLVFPNYSKYVSRCFETREEALGDKTVSDMICWRCNRMLHKKIRWFTVNQRNYYCLAVCPEHGPMRGKIRVRHAPAGGVYIVKTIKAADDAAVEKLLERREEMGERRKRKNRQTHLEEKRRKRRRSGAEEG